MGRGEKAKNKPSKPTAAAVPEGSLRPGASVRLHGLQGAAHLNGLTGVCQQFNADTGRWTVMLHSSLEQKSLKPDNLTVETMGYPEASSKGSGKAKGPYGKAVGGDSGKGKHHEVEEKKEEKDNANDEEDVEEIDQSRMASDQDSGFVCCHSVAAAKQAVEDKELRLEFGGVSSDDERAACLDFVCELLAGSERFLRGLSFASCGLTARELQRLAGALREGVGPKVAAFGISKNPGVAREAWHELFAALPPQAIWLDFGDNQLTDADIAPLVMGLDGREELDKLYLDGNQICDIKVLCEAIPETGITNLDLGDNNIDDTGARLLAAALRKSVLMILVLGTNPISGEGAKALFEALPRSSIDVLYLDNTEADDDCLLVLETVLADSKLSELHLDQTKITDKGVQALIPHIATSELNYLDVSSNNISDECAKELEAAVATQQGGIAEGTEEAEDDSEKEP